MLNSYLSWYCTTNIEKLKKKIIVLIYRPASKIRLALWCCTSVTNVWPIFLQQPWACNGMMHLHQITCIWAVFPNLQIVLRYRPYRHLPVWYFIFINKCLTCIETITHDPCVSFHIRITYIQALFQNFKLVLWRCHFNNKCLPVFPIIHPTVSFQCDVSSQT